MALPPGLAIAGGISGGLGLAQLLLQNRELKKAREFDEKRLEELLGRPLGLTSQEAALRQRELFAPQQEAAARARRRSEQLALAGGGGGAEVARLREEQARQTAREAERAALQVQGLNLQRRQQERAEIEQRRAAIQASRQQGLANTFQGLSEAATGAGLLAGEVPGFFQAAGLGGSRADRGATASPEQSAVASAVASEAPTADLDILASADRAGVAPDDQVVLEQALATASPEQKAGIRAILRHAPPDQLEDFFAGLRRGLAAGNPGGIT